MVRGRFCALGSALGFSALLSILVPACQGDPDASPSTTRSSCTQKKCAECTHEAACFWSKSRRACQTGFDGCVGRDCVNEDKNCKDDK